MSKQSIIWTDKSGLLSDNHRSNLKPYMYFALRTLDSSIIVVRNFMNIYHYAKYNVIDNIERRALYWFTAWILILVVSGVYWKGPSCLHA